MKEEFKKQRINYLRRLIGNLQLADNTNQSLYLEAVKQLKALYDSEVEYV